MNKYAAPHRRYTPAERAHRRATMVVILALLIMVALIATHNGV
jgi:Tfp pilus assembly protein PilX